MCRPGTSGRRCPSHSTQEYLDEHNRRRREAYARKKGGVVGIGRPIGSGGGIGSMGGKSGSGPGRVPVQSVSGGQSRPQSQPSVQARPMEEHKVNPVTTAGASPTVVAGPTAADAPTATVAASKPADTARAPESIPAPASSTSQPATQSTPEGALSVEDVARAFSTLDGTNYGGWESHDAVVGSYVWAERVGMGDVEVHSHPSHSWVTADYLGERIVIDTAAPVRGFGAAVRRWASALTQAVYKRAAIRFADLDSYAEHNSLVMSVTVDDGEDMADELQGDIERLPRGFAR